MKYHLCTRIAVVLADNLCTRVENPPCADCVNSQRPVADAVIRELADMGIINLPLDKRGQWW